MSAFTHSHKIRFSGFEVDFSRRELRKRGQRVPLQPKPFQILQLLLRTPGAFVTREELARSLWPGLHVSFDRCLNTAVNSLRHALGDSSQRPRLIETRSGLGYAFIGKLDDAVTFDQHQDLLRGVYLLEKMTEADTHKAIAFFESSRREGSALAHPSLAMAYCELARLSPGSQSSARQNAREHAALAFAGNPGDAASHAAFGRVTMLFDSALPPALTAFERALQLSSNCVCALRFLGAALTAQGDHSTALKHLSTAQALEPLSLPTGVDFAIALYAAGQYDKAVEQCWKLLCLEPRLWWAQLVLGLCYRRLNAHEESTAELQNALACSARHPMTVRAAEGVSLTPRELIFGCIPFAATASA